MSCSYVSYKKKRVTRHDHAITDAMYVVMKFVFPTDDVEGISVIGIYVYRRVI